MILACDEDVGIGIPKALKLVGLRAVLSIPKVGRRGQPDIEWLIIAGKKQWLAFSYNKDMLNVPMERDTIVREKVGIVFLTTGQETSYQVLRLLLNRWDWLNEIDTKSIPSFCLRSFYKRPSSQSFITLDVR